MARFETEQEVMDHVAVHMMQQGKRAGRVAADGGFCCEYIADDGSRCAIGACIENVAALASYAGSVTGIRDELPDIYRATFGEGVSLRLLQTLQSSAHDTIPTRGDFKSICAQRLKAICRKRGLTPPPVLKEASDAD